MAEFVTLDNLIRSTTQSWRKNLNVGYGPRASIFNNGYEAMKFLGLPKVAFKLVLCKNVSVNPANSRD
jgi:hypothetical protein